MREGPAAELLPCVEVEARGEGRGSVVWLHGLGADGHDFEPIVPLLGLPAVRFVFPNAPARPVTINGGMVMPAWYDIVSLSGPGVGDQAAGVRHSARLIQALLEREERRGVPSSRIVLAGFSQGAAMALNVGARYPRALLGIMVLSGYEVLAETRQAEASAANRTTPMLFCHGTHDPLVSIDRGRQAYRAHASPERPSEWHEFPIAHEVSPPELAVIRDWLKARFDPALSGSKA
jgi:phospholipase/carboxylesterase